MNTLVTIGSTEINPIEYNGQRVITLALVDQAHQRPDGTARRNFNNSKERLIEGEDYFVRNSYEARAEFDIIAPNGLVLLSETGYLMLVKSFQDDLAWQVQRQLVKGYFRGQAFEQMVKAVDFLKLQSEHIDLLRQHIDAVNEKSALLAQMTDMLRKTPGIMRTWEDDEVEHLKVSRANGLGPTSIGIELGRSADSVRHKIALLKKRGELLA